jgi:hypothetical protein
VDLFFDDSPGRTVIFRQAKAAIRTFLSVDEVGLFPFRNSVNGTNKGAAAAFDAIFQDFVGQGILLFFRYYLNPAESSRGQGDKNRCV